MLTSEMEKALICGIRKQQARRLIRERKIYRSGIERLNSNDNYSFINHRIIDLFEVELRDKNSLDLLNKEWVTCNKNMTAYDYNLNITFHVESISHDNYLGGYEEEIQKAVIVKSSFKFKSLKEVKGNTRCMISNHIRQARFKLVHQPNGKDTKNYLKIIENNT